MIESVEDEHIEHFKVTKSRPSILIHHEIDKKNAVSALEIEATKT